MKNSTALHIVTHAFTEAFDYLLSEASRRGVSDIHFAPRATLGGEGGEVRFRISGILQTFREFTNHNEWEDLLKEIKRRAGLSFQKGFAQDRRFSDNETKSDYRVSLVPVQVGDREAEQIVIRILPRDAVFALDKLGISELALAALHDALNANQGLIVVTGPTGSGKTVTLMSALCAIDRIKYNVMTLEDPVEYALAGITQVQVTDKISFAHGLRSFLRQDPDYILVGETRDKETASALIQAANTGHVVLTTLHTNSAADAFTRLAALGVDENLARENATFLCAQRLVPRLCPHCKEYDVDSVEKLKRIFSEEIKDDFLNPENQTFPMHAKGCPACSGTGVSGRELLFEFIAPVRNAAGVRELVSSPSLKSAAILLSKKGLIHANEALALF